MQESTDFLLQSKKTYLEKPIIYSFKEQVNIQKSKYSLLLTDISIADQTAINEILCKLDSSIKITDRAYIDSKKIMINKCKIIVEIQGIKTTADVSKPIWELIKAERCTKQVTLTKENVDTITIDTGKPQDYYQFKMSFFYKPIIYAFQEPVKLKRCPFSMQILEISTTDKETINRMLTRVDNMLEINDSPFIHENEWDENNYTTNKKYLITVQFKGYKRTDKAISPIWKLKTIQDFLE